MLSGPQLMAAALIEAEAMMKAQLVDWVNVRKGR
jgi:hypothetical protein